MRTLTKAEVHDWCTTHHIPLDDRQLPQPVFTEAGGSDFKIPADTGQRFALLIGWMCSNLTATSTNNLPLTISC
jgi:hypothetical protein